MIIAVATFAAPTLAQDAFTVPADPATEYSIRSQSPDLFLDRTLRGTDTPDALSREEEVLDDKWEVRSKYPELYSDEGLFDTDGAVQ